MSRNRPTTVSDRLEQIINQLDPVASQNRLKCPEQPSTAVTYPIPPEGKKSRQ